jgi:hypothetical protein
MTIVRPNWYGLDHDLVNKKFEGDLSFVNEFTVLGEYNPSVVYRAARPNKIKGHKKYVLLTKSNDQWYVRGMSPQKMRQFRYQDAIHCLSCDDVIYSVMRHDFRSCTCGSVSIDGGRDYTSISYKPNSSYANIIPYRTVTLDLLYNKVI